MEQSFQLDELSELWCSLERLGSEPWIVIQAIVILLVKAFFATETAQFQKDSRLKAVHITTGFVDGDLYEIATSIAPCA